MRLAGVRVSLNADMTKRRTPSGNTSLIFEANLRAKRGVGELVEFE
jgi:hypothetical protein